MGTETEIKLAVRDSRRLLAQLASLGPELRSARHFEDNFLFDFSDGRIRSQFCLVRVRAAGEHSSVTFKGPARAEGPFKSREELESPVADPLAVVAILRNLGLQVWFRYQKFRQEYDIAARPGGQVHVAFDETPIGEYLEIEGPEEGIRTVAFALGFPEAEYLRESYYALYLKFCRNLEIRPGDMVFSALRDNPGRKGE